MRAGVGIWGASGHLPQDKRSVEDLFREEGANFSADVAARLGIKQVPIQNGDASETASNMAGAAGREALHRAKVDPLTGEVVGQYSIMPQEYLLPGWRMSNKGHADGGATK